jgi:N6-L-threonylcarbamoyladenine synthase
MTPAPRLVLGLETSCDETAAAVVADGTHVLSNVIASQDDLHAEYRGVVPEIASRAHAERILPVARAAVDRAGIALSDLSAIAIGNRPGLIGCLLVGLAAAKALAWSRNLPLVGVDHVHAHLYAGLLNPAIAPLHQQPPAAQAPTFPALGLVISGGHTTLYLLTSPTHLTRLGSTIDDAVGEAYDKVATLLDIPFPGGPRIDTLAQLGRPTFTLPISRLSPDSLDFSFSGLKTAVRYLIQGVPHADAPPPPPLDDQRRADIAASFQKAAVAALILKLSRALDAHPSVRTLLIGGGVSANSLLRAQLIALASARKLDLRLPALPFCVDNAAMIAGLGHHLLASRHWASDSLALTAVPTTSA